MLDFKVNQDTDEPFIETSLSGKCLLTLPQLNKGTAFTYDERMAFDLLGKLPHRIETLDEQVERAYFQYKNYTSLLQKNIYLNNLNDKNQILFYKLLSAHLVEMLPIIYTPMVGTAVMQYSREYRQPRGLYIAHTDQDNLDAIIQNRSNPNIDLIVVTDGEGVLGIGDQGIGGIDIPVAKLMVYSLCGGIDPTRTLPIFLDVGTNNQALLDDPMYLGCRHQRIAESDYDAFIQRFVDVVQRHFPKVFLHWEDLGRHNARRVLDRYQHQLCTFNDDIQGTGAVALAALMAGARMTSLPLTEQRIVVYGAGSAGTGICDQMVDAMVRLGLTPEEAYARFWLIDRQGLLIEDDTSLTPAQRPYAIKRHTLSPHLNQPHTCPSLLETVQWIQPTVLIGCSAQPGAFSQEIIETMARYCATPLIFPLSNPDDRCEATPHDLLTWTKGKALIATGTAFEPVQVLNQVIDIAQCNNALVFPGIGLGILAVHAKTLSQSMLFAASQALSECAPCNTNPTHPLLPTMSDAQSVAKHIALAVAQCAIDENLAEPIKTMPLEEHIQNLFWAPHYLPFKKVKNLFT